MKGETVTKFMKRSLHDNFEQIPQQNEHTLSSALKIQGAKSFQKIQIKSTCLPPLPSN
eukprot:UN13589